MLSKNG